MDLQVSACWLIYSILSKISLVNYVHSVFFFLIAAPNQDFMTLLFIAYSTRYSWMFLEAKKKKKKKRKAG